MGKISTLHEYNKPVSTVNIFKGEHSNATSISILKGGILKEHISKIPAILVCIQGSIVFENEQALKETLVSGSYVLIEPMVKHWLVADQDSQLVLFK